MRIRDLIEYPFPSTLANAQRIAIRAQSRLPTDQEQMDAVANEHKIDVEPAQPPADAAFNEIHGGPPWVRPGYE